MTGMERLRHKDLRDVYWLLGECCELGQSPEAWTRRLFEFWQHHLGVHMAAFFEGSADMARGKTSPGPKDKIIIYGKPRKHVIRLMHEYWKSGGINDDPALPVWRKFHRPIRTCARHELASDEEWQGSTIVNEYYYETDSNEMILSACPAAEHKHLLMNLWRPTPDQPFNERHIRVVSLITHELSQLLNTGRLAPFTSGISQLSPRLKQVFDLLVHGRSEKEIADILGTSIHTVHNQVRTLYRILGVRSRSQLFALSLQNGLPIED